jgi:hypothetical protein
MYAFCSDPQTRPETVKVFHFLDGPLLVVGNRRVPHLKGEGGPAARAASSLVK